MMLSRQPRLDTKVTVSRTWWSSNWTPSTGSTSGFWQYFTTTAGSIPNIAEYVALFDMYKINSLKFVLRPRYDSFAGNDTTDTTLPGVTNQGGNQVHVIIDPRSGNTPSGTYTSANCNSFLENGKVRTYRGEKPITINIKYPCFVDSVNNTANTQFVRSKFLSVLNTGITHRGAHVFIQDVNFTGVFGQSYDVFVTASITFKGMK